MTVKTIDATDLRNNLGNVIDSVKSGETLIVKKRGKMRVAMIDLDDYEDFLASNNPEYLKTITSARKEYKKGDFISLEEMYEDL